MPRVTDEHRNARREQIVMAAWRCVSREGFHKTTMADVIGESGLSAGAVYIYFRSKDEIIAAIAERAVGTIDEFFAELLAREPVPTPAEALHALTAEVARLGSDPEKDMGRVALPAWGEAIRDGAMREMVAGKYTRLRGRFEQLVERMQAAGHVDPGAPPGEVAQVLFGLMPGFIVQRLILGDVTPDSYAAGIEALLRPARHAPTVAGGATAVAGSR
jgi:AcrR family transcriptional regulator